MRKITKFTIIAGYIFLSSVNVTTAQEMSLSMDADDDIDMILRNYHVVPLESQTESSLQIGFDYTEGDYGGFDKTKLLYVPISFRYTHDAWSFRVSSGYVRVVGEENITPGIGGGASILADPVDLDSNQDSDDGMGDIFLSGSYSFNELRINNFYIDITAQVKIPTADADKQLGTDKADVSLQIGATKIIGNFLPFVTVGYRYVGKTSRYNLQNIWFASLGMAYYLNRDITLGMSYDLRKSISIDTANLQEIQAYMDYTLTDNWGVYFYGITGLSDSSPNIGGGFQLKYNF